MTYDNKTIGNLVDMKCKEFNNHEAIIFPEGDSRYTFEEFRVLYNSLAKGLIKIGVTKGQHIAIMSFNTPYWVALSIAAAKIGAVFVSLNTGYIERELEFVLKDSMPTTLILDGGTKDQNLIDLFRKICPEIEHSAPGKLICGKLPNLKNVIVSDDISCGGTFNFNDLINLGRDVDDSVFDKIEATLSCNDVAAIYYTSGTTGNPKAVMITHYAIITNAIVSGKNMSYCDKDKILLCLPLYHVIGYVITAFLSIIFGSTLVIMKRFNTEKAVQYLEGEQCTAFNGVPTMFNFLLDNMGYKKYNTPKLKKGFIAGSYCQPSLIKDIIEKLHINEISIVYGQTEAIVITQTVVSDRIYNRLFTIGHPIEGVEAKIIDPSSNLEVDDRMPGELCVKSKYLMTGYYKNPKATNSAVDKDGWLHTGDLSTKDDEGYIKIIGRIKDIIIRGGENIAPTEIESVYRTCEGVRDVAVFGVPDETLGESICMYIVKNESSNITKESLIEFATSRLAKFKIPKYIEFVDILPITSSGKVKLFVLKDHVIQKYQLTTEKLKDKVV